jgi:hypothetical protein
MDHRTAKKPMDGKSNKISVVRLRLQGLIQRREETHIMRKTEKNIHKGPIPNWSVMKKVTAMMYETSDEQVDC